uniref:Cell division control protein 45 n=1 Tax=Timema bartmani TaxID=61472 RepID=A0A7R9HZU5_9NEOP|nr:unnamed protein product [Timema bartmani]
MYVEDLKKDFYNLLVGKRILLLVNYDVDAICACKILLHLFHFENILYTLVPVQGVKDLQDAFEANTEVNYVIFLNCGGTIDVVDALQPEEDVVLFIADSHKPTDVCNVYNNRQVRLLGKPDDDENIPPFEDIFQEDETDDEGVESEGDGAGDEDESRANKRRRMDEGAIMKRRERRLWEEKRNRTGEDEEQLNTAVRITYDKDLQLALYRHWTVEASLKNSSYTACKLKLWTLRGEKRLFELLAEMGLPLAQSRQKFRAMDLALRHEFHSMVEKQADKYGMTNIVYASFTLQFGFGNCYCASDVVYAMLALLEASTKGSSSCERFMTAMDCLSRQKKGMLDDGIDKAKLVLICIFKQVQNLLDMKQVVSAGPFVYVILQEGSLDVKPFSHPHCLTLLAQFALRAYVATSRNRKAPNLPIIASAPLDVEDGTCLVVGLPPVSEDSPKNFFGKAFEQAAEETHSRVALDFFDSSVMQLKVDDRPKFFDALISLLA